MNKIETLFKRDSRFKVMNEYNVNLSEHCIATEKVDGTNIRLTIRNGEVVRIEARKNPTKEQKKQGIINAWYRDVKPDVDKWIIKAVNNRTYQSIPDGEWCAEAFGEHIQGNPLNVDGNVFIFSYEKELLKHKIDLLFDFDYQILKTELKNIDSKFGEGKIEGIVYWSNGFFDDMKPLAKIKVKDFPNDKGDEN